MMVYFSLRVTQSYQACYTKSENLTLYLSNYSIVVKKGGFKRLSFGKNKRWALSLFLS